MKRLRTVGLFAASLFFAAPVQAGVPSEIFKDVPAGHWAEKSIEEVALERNLMQGYPDFSFRGEASFSRQDFVLALRGLVGELEGLSKISWKVSNEKPRRLQDVKDRDVSAFVQDYGLFEGILKHEAFEANHPVTRFELAKAVHNLLKLAEKKQVLSPPEEKAQDIFSDLSREDWAYPEVLELSSAYRVMVGFPDKTFRGKEELTRYQFAAVCAQTFPLIRELVLQAVNRKTPRDPRFRTGYPMEIALRNGSGPKDFVSSLEWSGIYYPSEFFFLHRLRGGHNLDALLAAGFIPPPFQGVQFQPYFGARAFWDKKTDGGLLVGTIAHRSLNERWGLYGDLDLTAARGLCLKEGEAGCEYLLSPKSALTLGLGFWENPALGVFDLKLGYAFGF